MRTKYFLAFGQVPLWGTIKRGISPHKGEAIKKLAFLAFGEVKKIGKQKYILYSSYFVILLLNDPLAYTNHQLFNKIVSWKLIVPFEILLSYKKKMTQTTATFGRRSAAFNISNFNESSGWWYLLNEERKYFEKNS